MPQYIGHGDIFPSVFGIASVEQRGIWSLRCADRMCNRLLPLTKVPSAPRQSPPLPSSSWDSGSQLVSGIATQEAVVDSRLKSTFSDQHGALLHITASTQG